MGKDTKTCKTCGETKPYDGFYRQPECADGYFSECKVCRAAYAKQYRAKNRDRLKAQSQQYLAENREKVNARSRKRYYANWEMNRRRNKSYRLKKTYGLTLDEWDALFVTQDSRCAICRGDQPGSKMGWHTDHCHDTGVVRGILCHSCNVALGHFDDSPALLLIAHAYLTSF